MKSLRSLLIMTTVVILCGCSASMPIAATSNPVGTKVGTAKETCILGITVGGEATIRAAVAAGGITKISTVDLRRSNVLGIVQVSTCIVTGE